MESSALCGGCGAKEAFRTLDRKCREELAHLSLGIFSVELAMASASTIGGARTRYKSICRKIHSYLTAINKHSGDTTGDRALFDRLDTMTKAATPMTGYREAYDYGYNWVERRQTVGRALIEQISQVAKDFGRTDARTNFQYVLWYDIVDSTGQKFGNRGDALRTYREHVRLFKAQMSSRLLGLVREAQRRNIFIYPWAGLLSSKDDEKNVFFAGPRSLEWVSNAATIILNQAEANQVFVRLLAINTNFAGLPAHKFAADPNVEGEAFWEHLSRLKTQLKSYEAAEAGRHSFFWLADDLAKRGDEAFYAITWKSRPRSGVVSTTIENFPLSTRYRGGSVTAGDPF